MIEHRAPVPAVDALDDVVAGLPGVRRAVLASADGFTIAASGGDVTDPSMAAMTSAAVGLARQLVVAADGHRLRQLVVDHDRGVLFIWPLGDELVLAVVSAPDVDQRALRRLVRAHRAALIGAPS